MKKLFGSFLFIAISFGEINAQSGPCPGGEQSIGVSFEITTLNFHRVKYDCASHFGFCIRGILRPVCPQRSSELITSLSTDGIVTGYGKYIVVNGETTTDMELHLPAAIKDHKEFINQDMSTFEVADDMIIIGTEGNIYGKVAGGLYTVQEVNSELIIKIKTVPTR